jgi:hypothetical protein
VDRLFAELTRLFNYLEKFEIYLSKQFMLFVVSSVYFNVSCIGDVTTSISVNNPSLANAMILKNDGG